MDEKNRMDFTDINRTFLSVCLQLYSLQEVYFIIYSLSINRILYINTLQIYKMFFKQEKIVIFFALLLYPHRFVVIKGTYHKVNYELRE